MGIERTPWRHAEIAPGVTVARALPLRARRTIGAWCFLDIAGPYDPGAGPVMDIGPHPHIGLQTVTWLLAGEVLHRDSLGSEQLIRPGQLNLMTSGDGIVHAEHEERPAPGAPDAGVHLAQLWVALPDAARRTAPAFEHHATLPTIERPGLRGTVLLGELDGVRSPATVFSPIVGVELVLAPDAAPHTLPLEPGFEHGVVVLRGGLRVDGESLAPGELLYLEPGRASVTLEPGGAPTTALLLGGEPFGETVLMWWNFVARTREEIEAARDAWLRDGGFGEPPASSGSGDRRFAPVVGDPTAPIAPPDLPWAPSHVTVP